MFAILVYNLKQFWDGRLLDLLKNIEIFLQIFMIARRPMSLVAHENYIRSQFTYSGSLH